MSDEIASLEMQIESLVKQASSPDAFPIMQRKDLLSYLKTDIPFSQTSEISRRISKLEIELIRLDEDRKATLDRVDNESISKAQSEKVRMSLVSANLQAEKDMLPVHVNALEDAIQRNKIRSGKTSYSESEFDFAKLRRKIRIAKLMASLCDEAKEPFRNNTRDSVQKLAEERYLKLIDPKEDHERLEFDSQFRVTVFYADGGEVALTPGQKALATFCILEALSLVSAMDFPLIVDSPGQGVDKEYMAAIFEKLLSSSDRQIIVLPTTAEIDAATMVDTYGSAVSAIYSISRHGSRETVINEEHRRSSA